MKLLDKLTLGIWNVGIIEKSVQEVLNGSGNVQIRWMQHHYHDRFFADPFLYNVDDKYYYILAEEFPFYTNVGFISMLIVSKETMKLIKKEKLIEGPCHLSYPFVYEGKIIPEAYRSDCCVEYKVIDGKVTKSSVVMRQGLIDQTFLKKDGYEWVFATDADNPLCGLKIFYRKLGETQWLPHKNNPISDDVCSARPGGHFFEVDGELYRPVQDSEKIYGHRIRIMKVNKLSPDEYKETEVRIISSEGNPPFDMGFHTFNVENEFVVVDGFREKRSFVVLPMCVKFPEIMRFLGERECK